MAVTYELLFVQQCGPTIIDLYYTDKATKKPFVIYVLFTHIILLANLGGSSCAGKHARIGDFCNFIAVRTVGLLSPGQPK